MAYEIEKYIWEYLHERIGNAYGTAGLIGNLYAESGLRADNLEGKYERKLGFTDESYTKAVNDGTYTNFVHDAAGYGLAQWTYHSRKESLLAFAKQAGTSIGDLHMQLDFLLEEIQGFKSVMNALKSATSVREASDIVMLKYEIPADQSEENQERRAAFGQKYFDMYAGNRDVKNMENAIERVIDIAVQEEGYLEKKSTSELDDKTANAGSGNYTKYARDLDNVSWFNGKKQGSAWCSVFVSWCFYQAFGRDNGKQMLFQPEKDNCAAGCSSAAKYYKTKGQFYQTPEPGDQIFFNASSGDGYSHTGLVERVDGGKVYTVEGNTSNSSDVIANGGAVRRKSYDLKNSRIAGYGRPNWNIACEKTIDDDAGEKETFEEYKAKVIADSGKTVNLRKTTTANGKILARVPLGCYVLVTCYIDDEWACVTYTQDSGAVIGYMMRKFLERVPEGADEQGNNDVIGRAEITEIEALVSEALVKIQNLKQRLGGGKNDN